MNIKENVTIVCFFAKKGGGGYCWSKPDSVDKLNTLSSSTNDIRN